MAEDLAIDIGLPKDSSEFVAFVAVVTNILDNGCTYNAEATEDIIEKCNKSDLDIAKKSSVPVKANPNTGNHSNNGGKRGNRQTDAVPCPMLDDSVQKCPITDETCRPCSIVVSVPCRPCSIIIDESVPCRPCSTVVSVLYPIDLLHNAEELFHNTGATIDEILNETLVDILNETLVEILNEMM